LEGTGETLTTSLIIGVYSFHVATSDKRYAPNYTPILVILGNTSMEVNFTTFTYPVTVQETGLPSGTSWTLTANTVTYSSATSMLTFPATNGTSDYVATVLSGTGGTPGTFTVRGAPLSVNVAFYKSTFPESGLPKGTNWQITTNALTENSTGSSIAFYLTNGTYGYTASVGPGTGGTAVTFSVSGSARTLNVTFLKVKFTESGLPAGMIWQVTASGILESSTGTTIVDYLTNGTYAYTVGMISGYHTTDAGSLTVSGSTVSRSIAFSRTTYLVKFAETGLAVGTKWCVTFNGVQTCATGSLISFSQIVNGTYGYSIGAVKNYSLGASYTGTVTVAGGGQGTSAPSTNVPWTLVKYKVTFTESGLPSHTNWQVTLNGRSSSSTGTTITFTISNGTYSVSIVSTGYTYTSNPTSPLTVNGTAVPVAVTFT
jgi:hypothetical protein